MTEKMQEVSFDSLCKGFEDVDSDDGFETVGGRVETVGRWKPDYGVPCLGKIVQRFEFDHDKYGDGQALILELEKPTALSEGATPEVGQPGEAVLLMLSTTLKPLWDEPDGTLVFLVPNGLKPCQKDPKNKYWDIDIKVKRPAEVGPQRAVEVVDADFIDSF